MPALHRRGPHYFTDWQRRLVLAAAAVFQVYIIFSHDGRVKWGHHSERLEVRGVAADSGAWNTIYPILLAAMHDGAATCVHLSGASARRYRAGGLTGLPPALRVELDPLETDSAPSSLPAFVAAAHTVTLIGASVSVEGVADVLTAVCGSHAERVALVEDRYGTVLLTLHRLQETCEPQAQATHLYVSDSIAAKLVRSQGAFHGSLTVAGAPMFDATVQQLHSSGTARHDQRESVRRSLGVSDSELLLLVVGQSVGQHEVLSLLLDAINHLTPTTRARVRVCLCEHPRQTAAERRLAEHVLQHAPAGLMLPPPPGSASSDSMVPGADVVLSGYSTTNYLAILWQVPAVVYVATPTLAAKFRAEKQLDSPPEVAAGAAWSVSSGEQLMRVLVLVHERGTVDGPNEGGRVAMGAVDSRMRRAQQQLCEHHDGRAAQRVWQSLL